MTATGQRYEQQGEPGAPAPEESTPAETPALHSSASPEAFERAEKEAQTLAQARQFTANEKQRLSIGRLLKAALLDSKALKSLLTNFLLAYNIRAGVALLLRALSLLVKRPKDLLSINKLLGEGNLVFRVEAVRLGLFLGGFTGIYRCVCHALATLGSGPKGWHSAVGGWLAGLSLYSMDRSWHRTLALYMSTRAVQCVYNFAKLNGYWHFWGSDWEHGDSLLFLLSSAQVMYAYVMRPETLPASYYRFIVRQGPIDETILQAVRDNNRGKSINLPAVLNYVRETGGAEAVQVVKRHLTSDKPAIVPCRALHPYTRFCSLHTLNAFKGTAKQIFPVYLSLALVPAVVLRFKNFAKSPASVLSNSLLSALRSTTFLAVFCSGYQAVICMQREVLQHFGYGDHKLWYYVAGVFSSLAILIERKSRRSELALYAFPRAMDSLYMILYDHKLAFRVPQGEVLLFCTAMSSVMWFYQNETACLSPLVAKLLDRFLPKRSGHGAKGSKSLGGGGFESADEADFSSVDGGRRVAFRGSSSSGDDADDEMDATSSNAPSRLDKVRAMERNKSTLSLSGGYTMLP